MKNQINRREFIKSTSVALAAGAVLGGVSGTALGGNSDDRLLRHRFGVNYVPSRNWYFCWNDWKPQDIARDFDRIAEIGADHVRIMLLWPWFQPNPQFVSPAHLDRLEELMRLAAQRKLDVLVTIFTANLLGVFFGFGALSVPFAIGSLLTVFGLARILYAASAVVAATSVLSLALTFPAPRQSAGVPLSEVRRLLQQPLILTLAILLFFESGIEWVLAGYLTTFLTRGLGAKVSTASWMLALYWSAMMLGRVLLSRILLHVSGHTLILASAVAVAASAGLMVAAPSLPLAGCAIVLLGVSVAAIYPTSLGLAGTRYSSHSGTVFGILIGVGLTGGMSLPWLVGRVSQSQGVAAGLSIPIACAAAIFAMQLLAGRIMRRKQDA